MPGVRLGFEERGTITIREMYIHAIVSPRVVEEKDV